jgi:hypothetical protein
MSAKEIGVTGVDVRSFHCNEILDQFVGWVHSFLEERNDNIMELLF